MILILLACFRNPVADVASNLEAIPDKVTDPDKVIHDYEWFHTAYTNVGARVAQIAASKATMATETDHAEIVRLRTDLGGQQQSCRELVADYNANAAKVTMGSFKGWSLPDTLNPNDCE